MLRTVVALLVACLVSPCSAASFTVARPDGSPVVVDVDRPSGAARVPIVLAIDGSLCTPEAVSEWIEWLREHRSSGAPYALVVVRKPGTTTPAKDASGDYSIGPDFRCSDEFKRYYTLDTRVLDHLQALAHLRANADWWDGRLLLWGFSDGAHVAARVGVYSPETRAAVLVGLGGGTAMADELERMMCAEGAAGDACRREQRERMAAIRREPVPGRTWLGDANTYAAWHSRLDAVEANVLLDARFPVLLVHGERDGSVPVRSARELAARLAAPRGTVQYREVAGMGHGLGSGLDEAGAAALRSATLGWLLDAPSR